MESAKAEVLLVDDDPVMLSMHKRSLEMLLGCSVRIFESGLAALRHLTDSGSARLIIANQDLPDITGVTLVRTLRHHPRLAGMAIMVLSGLDKQTTLIAAGANSVMEKRTAPLQLASEAQRLLLSGRAPIGRAVS